MYTFLHLASLRSSASVSTRTSCRNVTYPPYNMTVHGQQNFSFHKHSVYRHLELASYILIADYETDALTKKGP